MAGNLNYRLFQERDVPALLRLWESATPWGPLSEETWRQWYQAMPHGPCLIVVAEDESGEIAGQEVIEKPLKVVQLAVLPTSRDCTMSNRFLYQEVMMASRAVIGEIEVRSLRISAPILRGDVRGGSLRRPDHPLVRLYEVGVQAAIESGVSILYMLPDPAWKGAAKLRRTNRCLEFPCVSASVPWSAAHDIGQNGLNVRAISGFGPAYGALYETARKSLPIICGIMRTPAWLYYKNGGHLCLEARCRIDDSLVGYAAIKRQTGLLEDFLVTRPQDVVPVLGAVLCWLSEQATQVIGPAHGIKSLYVMQIRAFEEALDFLGFAAMPYNFLFVWEVIDPVLLTEQLPSDCWHLCPDD